MVFHFDYDKCISHFEVALKDKDQHFIEGFKRGFREQVSHCKNLLSKIKFHIDIDDYESDKEKDERLSYLQKQRELEDKETDDQRYEREYAQNLFIFPRSTMITQFSQFLTMYVDHLPKNEYEKLEDSYIYQNYIDGKNFDIRDKPRKKVDNQNLRPVFDSSRYKNGILEGKNNVKRVFYSVVYWQNELYPTNPKLTVQTFDPEIQKRLKNNIKESRLKAKENAIKMAEEKRQQKETAKRLRMESSQTSTQTTV